MTDHRIRLRKIKASSLEKHTVFVLAGSKYYITNNPGQTGFGKMISFRFAPIENAFDKDCGMTVDKDMFFIVYPILYTE